VIRIDGDCLVVETSTLLARIRGGAIVSLRSRKSGAELIGKAAGPALQLVYAWGEVVNVSEVTATVTQRVLNDHMAEVRIQGWDADGLLTFRECPATGELLVEPSAYAARRGVRACRWCLGGLSGDLQLAAPLFQGIRLAITDVLVKDTNWSWPIRWEAAMAILESPSGGGFWVHSRDTAYRYKGLQIGLPDAPHALGLETEAYGPLDSSLGAGGLEWRVNVFQGDWRGPAREYRQWLWDAFDLHSRARTRKPWVRDIRLAVSWCKTETDLLDALSERIDPRTVLLHLPRWRTDNYDQNYPTFTPSTEGRAFIAKAAEMRFHVIPHCNSVDMDPTHPAYPDVQAFEYRDLINDRRHGWAWESGKWMPVPGSNFALMRNRARNVMVKIHPGLAAWRAILGEHVQDGLADLPTDAVFLDVTLCSHNLHNCLVENQTSTQGMLRLIDHVAELRTAAGGAGLAVFGEGLNEVTAQGLSGAQAHLFMSGQSSCEGLERTGGCPLNALLFDGLSRTFGYSNLGGRTEEQVMRSKVHLSLGAIPTVTGVTAWDIREPSPHVRELLAMAAG
jgi:hypothetical protein